MKKRRTRVLIGILVGAMALTGVLVGTVSAADDDSGKPGDTILARVAEILGIDQADVENAFQQAVEEQRQARLADMEAARDARMQALIDDGIITQEQADEWEAWLAARPDNSDAMREWFESRPDFAGNMAGAPGAGRGMLPRYGMPFGGGFRGMGPGGLGGQCPAFAPQSEA